MRTAYEIRILKPFILIWVLYWFVVAILPTSSIYPNVVGAFTLQLCFVLIISCFSVITSCALKINNIKNDIVSSYNFIMLAKVGVYLSILGLFLLMYDKIYIQGIDYSEGIAVARESWRKIGESREGQASSVYSAIGYLLSSAYYVTVLIIITKKHLFSKKAFLYLGTLIFILMMISSLISGGRSNILLLIAFTYSCYTAKEVLPFCESKFQIKIWRFYAFLIISIGYSVYVFFARASVNDELITEYTFKFLQHLGVEPYPSFERFLRESPLAPLLSSIVLALSYISHGFATTAAIINESTTDKQIIFTNVLRLLYKVGAINDIDSSWFLAGRFPSLPGALWHQYGYFGFAIISAMLGVAHSVAGYWCKKAPANLLSIGSFTMLNTTLILSPALLAFDFMYFPFMVIAFIYMQVIKSASRIKIYLN